MSINGTGPPGRGYQRPDPDFRLVVTPGPDSTVIALQGELDLATTPELEAALGAQTGRVVVDLRMVSFADATGLSALLRAESRSGQNGTSVAFVVGEAVSRLIDAVGLPEPLTPARPPAP